MLQITSFKEIPQEFIDRYSNGENAKDLCCEFNIEYKSNLLSMLRRHLPNNYHTRKYQKYQTTEEYCIMYIKNKGTYLKCYIDLEDYEKCKSYGMWSLTKSGYIINYKSGVYLHQFILNTHSVNGNEIDHIDGDPLNNRKSNLRIVNSSQQKMNTKIRKDNTSNVRGVYYDKARNTWNVNINIQGIHYGKRFKIKEEAIAMADAIYEKEFGEYRRINS